MRGRYLDTHMPSTIEKTDFHSGKPRPCLPFLHHCIRFVADLPLHRDGPFLPVLERQTTGHRRSRLAVTQDPSPDRRDVARAPHPILAVPVSAMRSNRP